MIYKVTYMIGHSSNQADSAPHIQNIYIQMSYYRAQHADMAKFCKLIRHI